ncbi:hypothetical protein Mpsy_2297 [Methanolobus psychrophilus R15]|nr:hypothetical protein Mpsy_2297 [Methanolobus psychrophilus R15]
MLLSIDANKNQRIREKEGPLGVATFIRFSSVTGKNLFCHS